MRTYHFFSSSLIITGLIYLVNFGEMEEELRIMVLGAVFGGLIILLFPYLFKNFEKKLPVILFFGIISVLQIIPILGWLATINYSTDQPIITDSHTAFQGNFLYALPHLLILISGFYHIYCINKTKKIHAQK